MALNNKNTATTDVIATATKGDKWVTDYAWISGLAGALTVVALAAWYNAGHILSKGISVAGWQITHTRLDSILFALGVITFVMLTIELVRIYLWDDRFKFTIAPKIKQGHYFSFLIESVINYLFYLALLSLVLWFYHSAGEYGYIRNNAYYQSWFRFLDIVWNGYLWVGLPYVLITRAIKHSAEADARDYGYYFQRVVAYPFSFINLGDKQKQNTPHLSDIDKKITRGLLVKLFFTPLMTVFFVDQFPHLVGNIGYIFDGLPKALSSGSFTHRSLNNDFFNISISFIFSIDVALAWVGYVISSRWVDNQTSSAEPTMLGWVVCLACYPPFQFVLGLYYGAPGERDSINLYDNQTLVTIFMTMMLASYFVYMSATLWFGTRFSNLTNRGIIRRGPFAYIRHPAYASKNFAWWCIMFPAVIYNATHSGVELAIIQIIGLVLLTYVYYCRAITEERHLSADPCYREYCEQVKYRFIPKVF